MGFVQQMHSWGVYSVISSRVKVFNLVFKIFLLIPILCPFQFTKQAVIETYTLFLSNFKTATEAIKTTCQAKPAFSRFLEVKEENSITIKAAWYSACYFKELGNACNQFPTYCIKSVKHK